MPGKPEKSLLLLAITNKRPDGGDVMPPTGALPAKDIETLTKWVKAGLPGPTAWLDAADGEQQHEEKRRRHRGEQEVLGVQAGREARRCRR